MFQEFLNNLQGGFMRVTIQDQDWEEKTKGSEVIDYFVPKKALFIDSYRYLLLNAYSNTWTILVSNFDFISGSWIFLSLWVLQASRTPRWRNISLPQASCSFPVSHSFLRRVFCFWPSTLNAGKCMFPVFCPWESKQSWKQGKNAILYILWNVLIKIPGRHTHWKERRLH